MLLRPADLSFFAPRPVDTTRESVRLERFPPLVHKHLAGDIGPSANARSSTGCAVLLATDAPWLELHLSRLRHHLAIPQGVALEVLDGGAWQHVDSQDLRELEGDVVVRLPTGLVPGLEPRQLRPCVIWLPLLSTCAVAGIRLPEGCQAARVEPQPPRWLALGDSLTQGFSTQSPLSTWVHRLRRRWDLPVWNLGIGGLRIETEAVRWALDRTELGLNGRWDLVTIGLGSNHAWSDATADPEVIARQTSALAEAVLNVQPGRVAWVIPPWKPMEDGKGPPEFLGVPLNGAAAARIGRIRDTLRDVLTRDYPEILRIEEPMPRDHRLYPDGLHPFAQGFAAYANAMERALRPTSVPV